MRIRFDVAHHQLQPNGIRDFKAGQLLDGHLSQDELAAASIMVNLFDGGPKSVVTYRVNDGEYQPLTRTPRKDPYMLEQFVRHASDKKSFVQTTVSTHIFEADLSADLQPGVHTVTVRAEDEFGRVHHGHAVLEIIPGVAGSEAGLDYPSPKASDNPRKNGNIDAMDRQHM